MKIGSKRAAAIALGLALVAIILILVIVSSSRRDSSMVRRLPDGSRLKIVSVSYSHTQSYSMPAPNAWQSFLLKPLPSSWTTQLGLWTGAGSLGRTGREGEPKLVIFAIRHQA